MFGPIENAFRELRNDDMDKKRPLNAVEQFLIGALARTIAVCIVSPITIVKTRMEYAQRELLVQQIYKIIYQNNRVPVVESWQHGNTFTRQMACVACTRYLLKIKSHKIAGHDGNYLSGRSLQWIKFCLLPASQECCQAIYRFTSCCFLGKW